VKEPLRESMMESLKPTKTPTTPILMKFKMGSHSLKKYISVFSNYERWIY
jgi:hypothetical protein